MPISRIDRPWLRRAVWAAAAAAGLLLLFSLRAVLAPFLFALVLAYVLEPPVRALQRQGLPRVWSIVAVYALITLLIGVIVVFVLPQFLRELAALTDDIPRFTQRLLTYWRSARQQYINYPLPETVRNAIDQGIVALEARALAAIRGTVEGLLGVAAGTVTLVLVPFMSFYMLKDAERLRLAVMRLLPIAERPRWADLIGEVNSVLSGFVRGQVVVALLMAAAVTAVTALIGLPFAVMLGIIVGLSEFVPYFGPVVGSVPVVLLAAGQSTQAVLQVIMALIIIHQLEQAVLQPLIVGDGVGLHPLLIIFALFVGGHFFGLAGLLLAVPVAGTLRALWTFALTPDDPAVPPEPGDEPPAKGGGSPVPAGESRRNGSVDVVGRPVNR